MSWFIGSKEWTPEEIRDEYLDMYTEDPELDAFLNERDVSCSREELGLSENGEPEDA